jgi:TetR/AcrR family transcriptional regulator, transcriptional repressor for nem operon
LTAATVTAGGTVSARGGARAKLLDAAVDVIRAKGLSATSVDDLCRAAGVTKGAFFHHFDSKEALAVATADHWSATTGALFESAEYHHGRRAAERVLGYVELRAQLIRGAPAEYSCLAGTMVQEAFRTSPAVRDACGKSILGHASTLEADLAEALADAGAPHGLDAESLARFTQVVLQGAFVVSKAADEPRIALDAITHLHRYLSHILIAGEPV